MGNFSRNTFNKLKHYVGVRLQQGVPIVDADWNELEDIRKYELQAFLKWYVGNGIPEGNNGFHIFHGFMPASSFSSIQPQMIRNNFTIRGGDGTPEGAGRCLVEGWDVMIEENLHYIQQRLFTEDDLHETWNVDPLPTLNTPTADRTDTVYLDVWEREVNAAEDSDQLVNPAIGIETCVRLKREWVVRVAEDADAPPAAPAGHVFYTLAQLNRPANAAVIMLNHIVDRRLTGLSVASLATEIAEARGSSSSLSDRLDESLTGDGKLQADVVGNSQVKSDAAIDESKINFSDSGHDHSDGNGALIGIESLKESVRSKLVDLDRAFRIPLLRQTVFYPQHIPEAITSITGVAFDGRYVWVVYINSDSVSKIDATTNAVVYTVKVGTKPRCIAFDGAYIWVANWGSNNVNKINAATNAVEGPFTVGTRPGGIAFDGTYIWVANFSSNSVSKINAATNAVVATVMVGVKPYSIAFDGAYIWVGIQGSSHVFRVDIHQNFVVDTIYIGGIPQEISYDGSYIWIGCRNELIKLRTRI